MLDDNEIRVSVVMPAYNAAPFITAALASALRQSEHRLEVLVIDDCSRDATPHFVQNIAARDRRVRLLRNPVNRGPAASRNRGLAEARGEWIALLDADDGFAPRRLETLMSLGEQRNADLVADNLLLCPDDALAANEPMLSDAVLDAPRWLSPAEFVEGNIGSRYTPRISYGFLQPLMRRRFLRAHGLRYDERNRFGEDFMLYLACLLRGARWWLMPEAMYRYRVRSGTLTDVQSAADLQRIRSLEDRLLREDPLVASDAALADALRRHKTKIDRFYYYRAFTDAVKAGYGATALRTLLQSGSGFRHIVLESMTQTPRLTRKVLYHAGRAIAAEYVPAFRPQVTPPDSQSRAP
ncbi:MAG TPA: glycosyltransferase family 2 protein [Acetobacteraceae bacterium]|jgi:succinoglycan biosynthesis protein ExoO/succinoglycan biosynthesis protein ExoU